MTQGMARALPRSMRPRALVKAIVAIMFAILSTRVQRRVPFPYSDFFTPANPQHLSLTLFASAIGNESRYAATHEGFRAGAGIESLYRCGRARLGVSNLPGRRLGQPAYCSSGNSSAQLGVFMGGMDLLPFQSTSLTVLGGRDVGDSSGARIEGDF